jgi:hypothetical protein
MNLTHKCIRITHPRARAEEFANALMEAGAKLISSQ